MSLTIASLLLASIALTSPDSVARVRTESLTDTLVRLETLSWEAWKARDSVYFSRFLSADHVEMGAGGPGGKSYVVRSVASPACVVASYGTRDFHVVRFTADVAVLTYHAEQSTTCGGAPVPSPVWTSSLYVRRAGRWENALYQQTPTGAAERVPGIDSARTSFLSALATKDTSLFRTALTEDAITLFHQPRGGKVNSGLAEVMQFYATLFSAVKSPVTMRFATQGAVRQGNSAMETGRFTMPDQGLSGSYVTVYQLGADGRWRISTWKAMVGE
ncbi:MAG: hypothetical protein JWO05_3601 [Gemmatimonadetes bacterium]|nr:hypothetical protein [Gemmatimonadota bacterium]